MSEDTTLPKPQPLTVSDTVMDGSTFTRVSLTRAIVADSHLMHARIDDANASGMTFENVDLTGAQLHDVNLSRATIDHANLSDVSITNADLHGMTIDGIAVTDLLAKWHDG